MTQFFGRANTDGGRSLSLAGRAAGVSLLCLVLAGGYARAGEGEAEGEGARRQITVSGQGLVSVRPDVVRVQLGLRVKAVAIGEVVRCGEGLPDRFIQRQHYIGVGNEFPGRLAVGIDTRLPASGLILSEFLRQGLAGAFQCIAFLLLR